MSFHATVFNIMIASPGDVEHERGLVRGVVHEWNAVNASTRSAVLLPVGWETHSTPLLGDRPQSIINGQVLKDSDLLVAIFWTRLGTPTGKASSGTVEEIEEHVAAGKPALVYFSDVPVALGSVDQNQYNELLAFKEKCKKLGLYYTYDSPGQFQEKIRQDLSKTLNTHDYFTSRITTSDTSAAISVVPARRQSLSKEAVTLLVDAANADGQVLVLNFVGGTAVQVAGKNYVEAKSQRSRAIWEGAVRELLDQDLLESKGTKGELCRVTRQGYDMADSLKQQAVSPLS